MTGGGATITRCYAEVDSRSMSSGSQVRVARSDNADGMERLDVAGTGSN